MAVRSQAIIRRGINRLDELIQDNAQAYPVFSAIAPAVNTAKNSLNEAWQNFQSTAVAGDRERAERNEVIDSLNEWIQQWRSVIFLLVPGADENIHNLPSGGGTPDDIIRTAQDILKFIKTNSDTGSFSEEAIKDLGDKIETAIKETDEATEALPEEALTRNLYSEACIDANKILVRSLNVVRSVFGHKSPEYKQFTIRASKKEEEEIDREILVGSDQ